MCSSSSRSWVRPSTWPIFDPEIEVSPDKLVASYSLPLPSVTAGAFVMANLEVSTEIAVLR
ncbi:hypothetical protein STANM309S_00594 [Streptomyces tanashiensis]